MRHLVFRPKRDCKGIYALIKRVTTTFKAEQ